MGRNGNNNGRPMSGIAPAMQAESTRRFATRDQHPGIKLKSFMKRFTVATPQTALGESFEAGKNSLARHLYLLQVRVGAFVQGQRVRQGKLQNP
jgi:hypothetical protein